MSSMQTSHKGQLDYTHKCANTEMGTHKALLCLTSEGACGHSGWDHALLPALPPSVKNHHIFLLCFSSLCFLSFKIPFSFKIWHIVMICLWYFFKEHLKWKNPIASLWTACYTAKISHNNFDNYFFLMVAFFHGLQFSLVR